MVEVLLFHHAQGLTDGVQAFAQRLRGAGHTVHVPDLYAGRVFDDLEEGVGHARQVGFEEIGRRATQAAQELPADLVYAGFSLGVMSAQRLAQTRPGARGALLFHSCLPPSAFDTVWPADVPLQVHGMEGDDWFVADGDLAAARDLVSGIPDGEVFLYPGDAHLFADSSLPGYDQAAADLLTQRVLQFLARVS
ncbi:dienelactone hydrolase family protein [Nocardioides sp.]|uniref:dienelactone hydrolase family protein n=1 Tax=Nocardioides sp. TaxID=35761 RepID=UPI003D0FF223